MTTGRINQVAFLPDAAPERESVGDRSGAGVVRVEGHFLRDRADEGGLPPARFPFRVREHERPPVYQSKRARVLRGHGWPLRCPPRASEDARGEKGPSDSRFPLQWVCNTGTAGMPGPRAAGGLINERDRGETVRCASKEPANPNDPSTTHAPSRTTGDNPTPTNQRTHELSASRSIGNVWAESCPHRWARENSSAGTFGKKSIGTRDTGTSIRWHTDSPHGKP